VTGSNWPERPGLDALREVMARLRDPERGCPWDIRQTFASIAPYTVEEAFEVQDAIEQGDMAALCDELGDLLLQVLFHAQMAQEQGAFTLDEVMAGLYAKLIRRHPHVFGTEMVADEAGVKELWEAGKTAERDAKVGGGRASALEGVARTLPAQVRALKLQKRAAHAGFEWIDAQEAFAKLDEELVELRIELDGPEDQARRLEEFGDVLFSAIAVGRMLGLDAEAALRHANAKFERRFAQLEAHLEGEGLSMRVVSSAHLRTLWRTKAR
jgi:MazG family protein